MADDDDFNDNNNYNGQNDSEERVCKVYDKDDFFTVLVQMVLAAFALASLYIKRLQEVPRRTFITWALDVSKQAFGACYAHVLNMMIAAIIADNTRGESVLEDQCAWYGLSYLIDTTLGLLLAIVFLRMLDNVANERDWVHLKHSGVYTGPDGWKHWISQVSAWLLILSIVKLIIYLFMWVFSEPLAYLGGLLFKPLQGNIRFELLFVMIFFPGFLNIIYFWIADSFLKAKKEHAGAHEGHDETGLEDKKEALIQNQMESVKAEENVPDSTSKPWTNVSSEPKHPEATVV